MISVIFCIILNLKKRKYVCLSYLFLFLMLNVQSETTVEIEYHSYKRVNGLSREQIIYLETPKNSKLKEKLIELFKMFCSFEEKDDLLIKIYIGIQPQYPSSIIRITFKNIHEFSCKNHYSINRSFEKITNSMSQEITILLSYLFCSFLGNSNIKAEQFFVLKNKIEKSITEIQEIDVNLKNGAEQLYAALTNYCTINKKLINLTRLALCETLSLQHDNKAVTGITLKQFPKHTLPHSQILIMNKVFRYAWSYSSNKELLAIALPKIFDFYLTQGIDQDLEEVYQRVINNLPSILTLDLKQSSLNRLLVSSTINSEDIDSSWIKSRLKSFAPSLVSIATKFILENELQIIPEELPLSLVDYINEQEKVLSAYGKTTTKNKRDINQQKKLTLKQAFKSCYNYLFRKYWR